jgi:uncharacterized protein (TIGR03437 family)
MSKHNLSLAFGMCIAASVAAFAQPGTGYLFQLPGANSSSGQIFGYPYAATPLTASVNTLGPSNTSQIVAKPDGTGFYVLGSSLQIANSALTSFTTINGIASTPTALAASPDGKYAVVGASNVYIISASTGAILYNQNTGGAVVAIAISQDSTSAFILTNTGTANSITQINLQAQTTAGTLPFEFGGGTQLAISPLGLLYMAGLNRVYEINPATLQITPTGTIDIVGTPGPLHFSPDGTQLYFVNTTSNFGGPSLYQITLANYGIAQYPAANSGVPPLLSDVLDAGNGRLFAISPSATTLYDVATAPLGLSVSTSIGTLSSQAQNVLAAVISNELPSAVYLYLELAGSTQNSIYRITLSNNTTSPAAAAQQSGANLQFVGVPPNTGAANFLTYNINQTVAQGKTSLPLIAQVLDGSGRPIFGLPVTFSVASGSGVVVNTPTPVTNANGWVETTVVAPAAAAMYTVTLTAGAASTSFTINVPATGTITPTGPTSVTQVFIASGNGELIGALNTNALDPFTVLVTDTTGNPLPNVNVAFSVTSGTGISNATVATGPTGLASATFLAQNPLDNVPFEVDTVVASSAYGAVTFYVVEYPLVLVGEQGAQSPPPRIIASSVNPIITIPEGSVLTNAFSAAVSVAPGIPGASTPIPNVAIEIDDATSGIFVPGVSSPYASCQGSTLSDNTGTAHCNLIGTCGAALGVAHPVFFAVGDQEAFPGTITITTGPAQKIAILSGNNQTVPSGQTASGLLALVTDACGNPISGATVTWTVASGSATLSHVSNTSSASGTVSASVLLGTTPGPVQVTVSLGTTGVATFSITNQAVAATMSIVSGNNQTATTSTAFAQPLTVAINDANNNPVTGVTVAFTVTSGNVSISATSAVTNAQGQASITATAAQNTGSIVITATYLSLSATFNLSAAALGPQVTAAGFQNAASFQTGLVPCGLATATGPGLATGITGTVSGASFFSSLPFTLNGLSLTVNGAPAPIYQLSNTNGKQQVTFQTPCQATPSNNGTVVLSIGGATTTVTGVPILAAQPGIFFYTAPDGNPYGQVISAADGSYITATNPAKRGGTYYIIATGMGVVNPATATDSAGINGQNIVNTVIVGIANSGVPVTAAYYQPGEVGVYVIGFTIPATLTLTTANGPDQPLALAEVVNGQTIFGNAVFLPVIQ